MMKTYKAYIECINCHKDVTIKIPRGTKSVGYECPCPNCEVILRVGKTKEDS